MDRVAFFNQHAPHWDRSEPDTLGPRLARVVALADVPEGGRVLDVGTGTGVLIPYLLDVVGEKGSILAVDNSPAMLDVAREKQFPSNVAFLLADIHCAGLPDNAFDRVICNAAFPHFENRGKALAEMARMLRPGGVLVISHPIGREAVNNLHKRTGQAVAEDRVPNADKMRQLLEQASLAAIQVIDEPEFYLASGRKPDAE